DLVARRAEALGRARVRAVRLRARARARGAGRARDARAGGLGAAAVERPRRRPLDHLSGADLPAARRPPGPAALGRPGRGPALALAVRLALHQPDLPAAGGRVHGPALPLPARPRGRRGPDRGAAAVRPGAGALLLSERARRYSLSMSRETPP